MPDQYGNRAYSIQVTITVDPLSQCATPVASCSTSNLIGTTTVDHVGFEFRRTLRPTGVANFSLSANLVQVGYVLRATAPEREAFGKSSGFNIGTKVSPAPPRAQTSRPRFRNNTTLSVDGATTGNTGTTLGLALIQSGANFVALDPVLCTSAGVPFTPAIGAPTANIDVNVVGAGTPALTVTWTLDQLDCQPQREQRRGALPSMCGRGQPHGSDERQSARREAMDDEGRDEGRAEPGFRLRCLSLLGRASGLRHQHEEERADVDPCVAVEDEGFSRGNMSLKFVVPYPYDFRMGMEPVRT